MVLSNTTEQFIKDVSTTGETGGATSSRQTTSTQTITEQDGVRVTDVSLHAFARQRMVECVLEGMRPNTDYLQLQFNEDFLYTLDENIFFSNFVNDQGVAVGLSENWDQWKGSSVTDTSKPSGAQTVQFIKTDSNGYAKFGTKVPAGTYVGDSDVLVFEMGDMYGVGGKDSRASTIYRAHGLAATIEPNIVTTQVVTVRDIPTDPPAPDPPAPIPPPFEIQDYNCGDILTNAEYSDDRVRAVIRQQLESGRTVVRYLPVPNSGSPPNMQVDCWELQGTDPLAQSFSTYSEPIYVSSAELYFKTKASSGSGIIFQIREMINGFPGPKIIPGSTVTKLPANIDISTDASVATKFTFDDPVYLEADTQYCFVVIAYSTEYELHTSEIGQLDVLSGVRVERQPVLGSLFTSQNNQTWTPEQNFDIKFKLNKCNFSTDGTNEYITLKPMTGADAYQLIQQTSIITLGANQIINPDTAIKWYYKFDQTASGPGNPSLGLTNDWRLFEPGINMDLENLTTQILLKCEFVGGTLTPVIDKERAGIQFLKNLNTGAYLTRIVEFSSISPENLQPNYARFIFDYKVPSNCYLRIYLAINDDLDNEADIQWHEIGEITSSSGTAASEFVGLTANNTSQGAILVLDDDSVPFFTGQQVTLDNFSDNTLKTDLVGTNVPHDPRYVQVISGDKVYLYDDQTKALTDTGGSLAITNTMTLDETADINSNNYASFQSADLPNGWKEANLEFNCKGLLTSQSREGISQAKLKIELEVDEGYEAVTPLVANLKGIFTKRS